MRIRRVSDEGTSRRLVEAATDRGLHVVTTNTGMLGRGGADLAVLVEERESIW
jgi:hypothetical protein